VARTASKDFSRYAAQLRRVRAGERAADDGGKKVWHQAGDEVEVISFVDAEGKVTRQECHLSGTLVIWRAGLQVSTGAVATAARRGVAASEGIVPDANPNADAVAQALTLLEALPPGDRYLDHLRAELDLAAQGLETHDADTVTTMSQRPALPPAPGAPERRKATTLALGAAVLVVVLGCAVGWMLLRP
jgi:hypothetical protein